MNWKILAHAFLGALFICSGESQNSTPSANVAPRPSSGPVYSPDVADDNKVTFRLRAPNAKEVRVTGEWGGAGEVLTKDSEGIWSVTIGPLKPELYGYSFTVDGMRLADPGNPKLKPMRAPITSILDIPAKPPGIHDLQDVPHGSVNSHFYFSDNLKSWRRVQVYTPPGYGSSNMRYPVLYLFHGAGDNEATWTELGRAHVILDNLIATQKAIPMLIVMPDGHPLAGKITGVPGPETMQRNVEAFAADVLEEVMPLVEKEYRTINKRAARAVAGLSMGGGQSLHLGLNHPDVFGAVGAFSAFVANPAKAEFAVFKTPSKPELIWTACGKEDRLIQNAKELSDNLKSRGVKHQFLETEGNHSWPVWRKYLAEFAPLLFRDGL